LIFDKDIDKNKLAPFYGSRCIMACHSYSTGRP